MADNVTVDNGALTDIEVATDKVTHSGDANREIQLVRIVQTTGAEGAKTVVDLPGDATDGLLVNLGANNDVTVSGVSTAANQTTIIGHVDGIEGLLGTIDADTGSILTSVQVSDNVVVVLGTDTYTEATSSGTVMAAVRRDADTTLVGLTNEYTPLQVDANGRLKVEAFSGEALPVTLTSTTITGSVTVAQATAANLNMTEASAANILTAVQLIDDIVYVDDTATHSTGTSKGALIMAAAVPTDASVTANDIGAVAMTTDRKLHVAVMDALPAGTANIGDVDVLTLPNVTLAAGTNTNEVVGDGAHDVAITGNPVRVGARGISADYTAVTTGDTADLITTLLGKLVTKPYALPGQQWQYAGATGGITDTTAVTIKAAGAAGVRNYVTDLQVVNGHATVSTEFAIRDGAAGAVIYRGWAQAAGGGISIKFGTPLRGTAATLLEVVCITTGSATRVSAQGYEAAE